MSVDSFYYCSDLERAEHYWSLPLRDLDRGLREWKQPDEPKHMWLYTPDDVKQDLVPQNADVALQYSPENSLSQIWQSLYLEFSESYQVGKKTLAKLIKSRKHKQSVNEALKQMIYIASFFNSFVQLSRQGPVSEVANTKFTDQLFPEILECYMAKDEAIQYKVWYTAERADLCVPSDVDTDDSDTLEHIRSRIGAPTRLDATWWQNAWMRLDNIPNLWEDLAAESNYENGIQQLRELAEIARFAVENDLALIKEYC